MPQNSTTDENHPVSRWKQFHFSGKVIICSVLFGLGLVLIGGLVFAIGINDNEDEKLKENTNELPTKAPSSIVGPVIMGIGGFIATVGVIMCLFETQVCRKRKGDARPLITEQRRESDEKNTDPTAIATTSRRRENHRHKKSSSPRRSKGTKKLHSSKDRSIVQSPSAKSPPIVIGSSRNFLTSSESNFHTPPSSFAKDSVTSNSREAEIQTGTSLMKSFTSSGPSWNTSTEFKTPEASFKEMSSLETSVQTDDLEASSSTLNAPLVSSLLKINTGFLTPITPTEETAVNIKRAILEQKSEVSPLVQSRDQIMSNVVQNQQENISNIVSDVSDVRVANFVIESKTGEPNTIGTSTEHSKTELLKEALIDSNTYVVLQNDEMNDNMCAAEKDNVDILFNPKINERADSQTISFTSISEKNKLDEDEEKMNRNGSKPSEQSDILHNANLADNIENFEDTNDLGVSGKEDHVDKLISQENVTKSEEKSSASVATQERNTNNFDTNDMVAAETVFRDAAEVETPEITSSEQTETVTASPSDERPNSNEQNESIGSTIDDTLNSNEVSDDSQLNSS